MATDELPKMEYVRLGNSGLKISKVILGAMSYGSSAWQDWVLDEEAALPLLKHAYDCGINTWDTADIYSHGRSEAMIGKALRTYKIPRSRVVILTKLYFGVSDDGTQPAILTCGANDGDLVNRVGLSRKHVLDAVEKSVERLGTYIDVLQIHRLDRETPGEEVMRALNDVVESGRVRYLGASSMAAWEFQNLQNIALSHNWHTFISMQPYYNLLYREEEREMLPYCAHAGIGVIPWSPLARGLLARPYHPDPQSVRESSDGFLRQLLKSRESDADREIIGRVETVARRLGVSMATVAMGWVLGRGCCPILGLASRERIEEAVRGVGFVLGEEDRGFLEEAYVPKAVVGY